MGKRVETKGARPRRRRTAWLWAAAVIAVIAFLLNRQYIAVLYVLSTVSLATLLIIVAFADLGEKRTDLQ